MVTSHTPHFHYLPAALESIEGQPESPAAEKLLVLDRASAKGTDYLAYDNPPEDWQILQGNWSNPGEARNTALDQVTAEWVIFWDSDNQMPPGYLANAHRAIATAADTAGILYPDMRCGDRIASNDRTGDTRLNFFTDTSSVWRKDAILHAGRWPTDLNRLEDWELGTRVQQAGWSLEKLNTIVTRLDHREARSRQYPLEQAIWEARPMGVVVLHRGNPDLLKRHTDALEAAELPAARRTGLTIVDDSGTKGFRRKLGATMNRLSGRFRRITIITAPTSRVPSTFAAIHDRVGGLYADAIAATPEQAILTWEDDVIPHEPTAARQLSDLLLPNTSRVVAGAAYESRNNPGRAVASREQGAWGKVPRMDRLEERPFKVTMTGGGFTLWQRAILEQHPILGTRPFNHPNRPEARLGWDGFVCDRIHAAGWEIYLHGAVRCDHLTA